MSGEFPTPDCRDSTSKHQHAASNRANRTPARIAQLYPNPLRPHDRGEFVRVALQPTGENWTLTDGETTVSLPAPNATSRTRLVTGHPALVGNHTSRCPVVDSSSLALSNSGETVTLLQDGRVVDAVSYTDAPAGMVAHDTDAGELAWRPFGTQAIEPVAATDGTVRTFVFPDSGGLPTAVLDSATDRIKLAAYTLSSRRVVDALAAAAARGVDVQVLVEGGPVGGMSRRQARLLDTLVTRSNASVAVMTGPHARYRFHHAKYAVVDDRALVMTENWKPAGAGGRSSRGWGVLLDQPPIVDGLADIFAADTGWYDTTTWTAFRRGRQFNESVVATGGYPRTVAPETVPADRVQLLTAPDNAEREILDRLQSATESIRIVQVSIGSRNHPFLKATLNAARRGVDVQLLLSRAWYAKEENRALVTWLQQRAATENLSLAARLARPRTRYEKIHAKGVVVDGQHVVLGSPNWNNNSLRNNREVAVALDGRKIGAYYASVFSADWEASAWRAPLSLFGVLGISVGIVCYRLRELQFE